MATTTSRTKRTKKDRVPLATGPGGPWSTAAPSRLRESYQGGDDKSGWSQWRKHLSKRKLRTLEELSSVRQPALFWALPDNCDVSEVEHLVGMLCSPSDVGRDAPGLENAARIWLNGAGAVSADVPFAFSCLAWASALPALVEYLPEKVWWQICNGLLAIASEERRASDSLAVQLLHVELPVLLAYCFPELAAGKALVAIAHRTLEKSTIEPLDENALVHGRRLDTLRPLLACWTRTRMLSRSLDDAVWSEEGLRQYARLVEYSLRLTRPDGRQVLSSSASPLWNKRLVKIALRLTNHAKTRRIAELLKSGSKDDSDTKREPRPAFELELAGLAVLRNNWRRRSPQLVVDHSTRELASELSLGKTLYWSGVHPLEVRFDGRMLAAEQPWDQLCWTSDEDVDYLELEIDLAEGVRVQRLIALAREDNFLFIGDAVLSERPGKIEYRSVLPLAMGVNFTGEEETREGMLSAGQGPPLRVLPLALGEWRSGSTCGALRGASDGLELTQSAYGEALFAPLFIDLDPRRIGKEVTWRQLTVGKNRAAVPQDEAAGYRVQVGRNQWVIYRALGGPATRTVLGRNLYNELLIGRFQTANGNVKTILEIEA
jgi:hypothetical protein